VDFIQPHTRSLQLTAEQLSDVLSGKKVIGELRSIVQTEKRPLGLGVGTVSGLEGELSGAQALVKGNQDFSLPAKCGAGDGGSYGECSFSFAKDARRSLDR
jgi:hypothetical protein